MPPPAWLNPPCDLYALSGPCPDNVSRWLLQNRAHPEAIVAWVIVLFHTRTEELTLHARQHGLRMVDEPLAQLAALEAAHGHPNAAYVLGACAEMGKLCQRADPAKARALYLRGWARWKSLSCAVGLHSLAGALPAERRGAELRAAEDRLIAFFDAPDPQARARATGAASALRDALWVAASAHAERGGADHARASARLFDLGAALKDPHCLLHAMRGRLGGAQLAPGLALALRGDPEGEALARTLAALPAAAAGLKSEALGVLGLLAYERGEGGFPDARRLLGESVAVCERAAPAGAAGDMYRRAIPHLTMMLFEGQGGPRDAARGEAVLAHGVRLGVGDSLSLAAVRAQRAGRAQDAHALWLRAADAKMPDAVAVVHGITITEAMEKLAAEDPLLAAFAALGVAPRVMRSEGGGAPVACVPLDDRVAGENALFCSACGKVGRMQPPAGGAEGGGGGAAVAAAAAAAALPPALFMCSRCHKALYCGAECQQRHWAEHKPICKKAAPKKVEERGGGGGGGGGEGGGGGGGGAVAGPPLRNAAAGGGGAAPSLDELLLGKPVYVQRALAPAVPLLAAIAAELAAPALPPAAGGGVTGLNPRGARRRKRSRRAPRTLT
jgi:hypothetical protein